MSALLRDVLKCLCTAMLLIWQWLIACSGALCICMVMSLLLSQDRHGLLAALHLCLGLILTLMSIHMPTFAYLCLYPAGLLQALPHCRLHYSQSLSAAAGSILCYSLVSVYCLLQC